MGADRIPSCTHTPSTAVPATTGDVLSDGNNPRRQPPPKPTLVGSNLFLLQATDAECAEIGELKADLLAYDKRRRELGISDRRLRRSQVRETLSCDRVRAGVVQTRERPPGLFSCLFWFGRLATTTTPQPPTLLPVTTIRVEGEDPQRPHRLPGTNALIAHQHGRHGRQNGSSAPSDQTGRDVDHVLDMPATTQVFSWDAVVERTCLMPQRKPRLMRAHGPCLAVVFASVQPSWPMLVGGVAARTVWATGLLVLATPGIAVLSPLFVFGEEHRLLPFFFLLHGREYGGREVYSLP